MDRLRRLLSSGRLAKIPVPLGTLLRLRWVLPALFLMLAPPICVVLAVLVPPGGVPDEPNHIVRADSLRHGELFGRRAVLDLPYGKIPVSGVVADRVLIEIGYFMSNFTTNNKISLQSLAAVRARNWTKPPVFIEASNVAVYAPVLYVPAALTLEICRAGRLLPIDAIIVARLVNALLFCGLGAAALALAQHARFAMFLLLMLPISLSLAASFNPDGLFIASVALSVALASRIADGVSRIGGVGYWIETVLLLIVISLKPPYAPFALLLLIPEAGAPFAAGLPRRIAGVGVATVPAFIWFAIGQRFFSAPLKHMPPYHPGQLSAAGDATFIGPDPIAQLGVVLRAPVQASHLLVSWFIDYGLAVPYRGIVGQIGVQDIIFETRTYALWYLALGLAVAGDVFGTKRERFRPAMTRFLLAGGAATSAYVLVVLSLYLTWTLVGMPKLDGMQGRYLTPLLLVMALATPRLGLASGRWIQYLAILAVASAGLAELIGMPQVLALHYYAQP